MNKKNAFSSWYSYVAAIAVSVLVVNIAISIRCTPTEKESIYVFAAAHSNDTANFVKNSKEVTDENIRKIEVINEYTSDNNVYTLFSGYYQITDIFILPTSWLEKINLACVHYSETEIINVIPKANEYGFKSDTNGTYAFKIYDNETKTGYLDEYFEYDEEDYYILFREGSYHINSLKESYSDNAIKMINHLLEL